MFKSIPFASRFITAYAVFALIACFGCSTKSQLVGTWSNDPTLSRSMGGEPSALTETWKFSSDNTGRWQRFSSSGNFKYTILDDGRVKIVFQGGQQAEGKLGEGGLILAAFGEKPVVFYKEKE